MGGGFSRPCSGYGNGQCGCSTCLHAERTVGIYRDREPELCQSTFHLLFGDWNGTQRLFHLWMLRWW